MSDPRWIEDADLLPPGGAKLELSALKSKSIASQQGLDLVADFIA